MHIDQVSYILCPDKITLEISLFQSFYLIIISIISLLTATYNKFNISLWKHNTRTLLVFINMITH